MAEGKFKNIFGGLVLSVFSALSFFFMAEGITRVFDKYIATTKIALDNYDNRSRLEDYSLGKLPGTYRILVLGDSTAYGQGVNKGDTFSQVLEKLLNRDATNIKYEVINTGRSGVNTTFELGVLLDLPEKYLIETHLNILDQSQILDLSLPLPEYQRLPYSPDIILLQYTLHNDAYSPEDTDKMRRLGRFKTGGTKQNYGAYALPLPETIDKWLTYNSKFYLFSLVKYHGFLTRIGLRDEKADISSKYTDTAIGWKMTRMAMARIGAIARIYNVPAIIVIYSGNGKPDDLITVRNKVKAVSQEHGFYILDLSESIEWPKENLAVSLTDLHPNAKAHSLIGKAVYNFLIREHLVP